MSDEEPLDCPDCPNQGWYMVEDQHGEPEPVPCEFCYRHPRSRFNAEHSIRDGGQEDNDG